MPDAAVPDAEVPAAGLHIVVCAKQVLDPDGVNSYAFWGRLAVDASGRAFDVGQMVPRIINAYDEQAVEAALRIRDAGVDCRITVVTVGDEEAGAILKRCVAMGADDSVQIVDPAAGLGDGFRTARLLAGLIEQFGDVDLVLCGRQGSDYDQGTVPAALAERLDAALVTMSAGVEVEDGALRVVRVTPRGEEVVRATLPAVVSISNEIGTPRYPSSRRMMQARRQRPERREASDYVDAPGAVGVELTQLIVPDVQGHCVIIEGGSAAEKAARLMRQLEDRGLLSG